MATVRFDVNTAVFETPQKRNMCSVGLERECPGIGKIEGELFIPRENFSFSEIVVKVSCQTERSEVWQA